MKFNCINCLFVLFVYVLLPCEFPLSQTEIHSYNFNQYIQIDNIDSRLLEKAFIYFTNMERKSRGLRQLKEDSLLAVSARSHSKEMSTLNYFSHESPVEQNKTLQQRYKNSGVFMENIVIGENIGVDFILDISGIEFFTKVRNGKKVYINGTTRKAILPQTYRQFASTMVKRWMKSPHHRENILRKRFEKIGMGIAKGKYKGLDAIYVTQNFSGTFVQGYKKKWIILDHNFKIRGQ